MANPKVYPLTFASAATSTNSVYIGNATRMYLYHSGTTAFNAGTGNIDFRLLGGFDTNNYTSAVTLFRVQSSLIQTDISGGVYGWPMNLPGAGGIPRVAVEFGTAVTGGAANQIYLITNEDM